MLYYKIKNFWFQLISHDTDIDRDEGEVNIMFLCAYKSLY